MRSARKHIGWYVRDLPGGDALRRHTNTLDDCAAQTQAVNDYFLRLGQQMERLPQGRPATAPGATPLTLEKTLQAVFEKRRTMPFTFKKFSEKGICEKEVTKSRG